MADIDVKAYIDGLRRALPYVPPIPVQEIKALHRERDFGAIVRLIRSTMNVDVGLTLHWTNGPPPKGLEMAKAWIKLPKPMPYYGTPAFKDLKLDIFILKSFATESTYHQFTIAVAHELSHVVLESIEHPLRSQEPAVDLTAMLLGFSYLYRTAAHTVRRVGYNVTQRSQLGYLSKEEMDTACNILLPDGMRARHAALNYLQQSAGALILLALCAGIWAFVEISNTWNARQIAVAAPPPVTTIPPPPQRSAAAPAQTTTPPPMPVPAWFSPPVR
jgi:hypothetical protein